MNILGRDIEIGVATEETRGTAESSMDAAIQKVDADVVQQADHVVDNSTKGVMADATKRRVVQKWIEGELNMPVRTQTIGWFLKQLYGAVSSEEIDASGAYDHTFTMEDSHKHDTLSLFLKDGSVGEWVMNGGVVGELELNASPDDLVRVSMNLGALSAETNSGTYNYLDEFDFVGKDVQVLIADTVSGLDAADASDVDDLTVTFDPNIIMDKFVLGKYNPTALYNAGMNIEVELTKDYDDTDTKDLFVGDGSKAMRIDITGTGDVGGANAPALQVTLPKVQVTDHDRTGTDPDEIVTEDVTYKAMYSDSESKQSETILTNANEGTNY